MNARVEHEHDSGGLVGGQSQLFKRAVLTDPVNRFEIRLPVAHHATITHHANKV